MPQTFQVLRCYKCLVFQIHQTKKSNKFECKVCGEKQSIKRHYGIGTGKDCRLHVQRLNSLRGETDVKSTLSDYDEDELEECKTNERLENNKSAINKALKRSKWSEFVDKEEEGGTENNESMFLGDSEVVLELPQKRKYKKFKVKTKSACGPEENLNVLTNTYNFEWEKVSNLDEGRCYKREDNIEQLHHSKIANITQEHPQNIQPTVSNEVKSLQKLQSLRSVSKNSKWAQFVEENENEDPDLSNSKLDESLFKTDNLFTLCDDNDLDAVLDI